MSFRSSSLLCEYARKVHSGAGGGDLVVLGEGWGGLI